MTDTFNLLHQLEEDEAEIARHHRSFAEISRIVEAALLVPPDIALEEAIRMIRNIVG